MPSPYIRFLLSQFRQALKWHLATGLSYPASMKMVDKNKYLTTELSLKQIIKYPYVCYFLLIGFIFYLFYDLGQDINRDSNENKSFHIFEGK